MVEMNKYMHMKKIKIPLIIEWSDHNLIYGRVNYDDNLMVDSATSIDVLKKRFEKLLKNFHNIKSNNLEFDIQYDIAGLFDQKKYLNASAIADQAGISRGLMRQYMAGNKYPSAERALVIQNTIRNLGKELQKIKMAIPKTKRTLLY